MARILHIHPDNPQPRLINEVAECLRAGGVVIYPTDSSYAMGCHIGNKEAMDVIRRIRRLDDKHNFTLVCRDLSDIATYALVENSAYRMMKALTPGPYTFILKATREVPRRLQHPKRKTIGLRVPDSRIVQAILHALGHSMMSSTMLLPEDEIPLSDAHEIEERVGKQVELIVDGGYCGIEQTTVIDLAGVSPVVLRVGKGEVSHLLL